ncbi:MAG TPA: hypothetical protein VFO12_11715 [Sphingomicrobium sp.]|nr:hypothetical protein [Sphingomicrobium sp.]
MPYRNAPYYILACIAVIVAGFWQTYFAKWGEVPWQFHAHGVAAGIWVLMVLFQSWAVHKEQLPAHRIVGKSSLILFPFLIGGLAAIIDLTGKTVVTAPDPVRTMFGSSFVVGLGLAIAAYVTLYYRALKYRRKVWVHSGYMLATPLILFESPFGRILNTVMPGLAIRGPDDLYLIMYAIQWGMAAELLIVAVLWWRFRDKASPFLVAGAFIVAQMVAMGLLSQSPVLMPVLTAIGNTSSAVVVMTGFAIGAATSWAGWNAGKRPTVAVGAAAQAA